MGIKYSLGAKDKRRHLVVSQNIHDLVKWHAYNKKISITEATFKLLTFGFKHYYPKANLGGVMDWLLSESKTLLKDTKRAKRGKRRRFIPIPLSPDESLASLIPKESPDQPESPSDQANNSPSPSGK
jgi:hypothetical protein